MTNITSWLTDESATSLTASDGLLGNSWTWSADIILETGSRSGGRTSIITYPCRPLRPIGCQAFYNFFTFCSIYLIFWNHIYKLEVYVTILRLRYWSIWKVISVEHTNASIFSITKNRLPRGWEISLWMSVPFTINRLLPIVSCVISGVR